MIVAHQEVSCLFFLICFRYDNRNELAISIFLEIVLIQPPLRLVLRKVFLQPISWYLVTGIAVAVALVWLVPCSTGELFIDKPTPHVFEVFRLPFNSFVACGRSPVGPDNSQNVIFFAGFRKANFIAIQNDGHAKHGFFFIVVSQFRFPLEELGIVPSVLTQGAV